MEKYKKLLFVAFACLAVFSCKKNDDIQESSKHDIKIIEKAHCWYTFSENDIISVNNINEIPKKLFKPWTETVRVTDAISIDDDSYFLVNNMGLLHFFEENEKPAMKMGYDNLIFSGITANKVLEFNKKPIISLYRNIFFSENENSGKKPILVMFDEETDSFYPLLEKEDLALSDESEVIKIFYDKKWYFVIKENLEEEVIFSYLTMDSDENFLNLLDKKRKSNINIKTASMTTLEKYTKDNDATTLPENLKSLLIDVPKTINYQINFFDADRKQTSKYTNQHDLTDIYLYAEAFKLGSLCAALFEDGTFLVDGKIYDTQSSNRRSFKLPKLPDGFVYTNFIFQKDKLYAGWEEKRNFMVGRSGFLCVELKKVL